MKRVVATVVWVGMVCGLSGRAASKRVMSVEPQAVSGWSLRDAAKVPQAGGQVSSPGLDTAGWYPATVPGTVLTTLVNNHVYPEPLYGENNRPEIIPESLAHGAYWYRTEVAIPVGYAGQHVWLNLDGVNYAARVWVNGSEVGTMRGAFVRGAFDVTYNVKPGRKAVIAVLVSPQPHPGVPHEHTLRAGIGENGGESAIDGPTFLSTIGWDWLPAIRDRDAGIWQKVYLSTTGPVRIKDPLVTTDLPLPRTDSADLSVQTTLVNLTDRPVEGVLRGSAERLSFEREVELAARSSQLVSMDVKTTPALHLTQPKLWWPNGYGAQNLYRLRLSFEVGGKISDNKDVSFGVRKISYAVPDSDNLTISVNGVKIFIRGGNWGLDEGLKRIPRERLDAAIRMHQFANLNMIRNWVGQSTGEDFYDLCDKYGILVWDEFFQPNPSDGPDPTDLATYMANVRDKLLRFRNHPSIVLWCARNEGYPPKEIDDRLRVLMTELEPVRLYQPSSTEGRGVRSHGPYRWREPREFYKVEEAFKTETGSISVPTLESIKGMMPEKDWETINDDWAEHDFARGNQGAENYPEVLAQRYGKIVNLADFTRKSQLMNYEAFRAMYEGRNAQLFKPTTAVLTWMSHPAQPSFVWQIYHYDLEPNSSFFAVKSASEPMHLQYNEADGNLQVINNRAEALTGATARFTIYNLDGSSVLTREYPVTAPGDAATSLGVVEHPANVSPVHFIQLSLTDADGKPISENFYWRGLAERPDDLTSLDTMRRVTLDAGLARRDINGKSVISVTLHNADKRVALMAHVQLRRSTGERVLPAYYSRNYVSLAGGETKVISVEADTKLFGGRDALVVVDGWNVVVADAAGAGVSIRTNMDALVEHSPATGLPYQTTGLR